VFTLGSFAGQRPHQDAALKRLQRGQSCVNRPLVLSRLSSQGYSENRGNRT
jgi:hypothetical protein